MAIIRVASRHATAAVVSAVAAHGATSLSTDGYKDLLDAEAMVSTPYVDVAGVRTVCVGETYKVEDRVYHPAECAAKLVKRVETVFVPEIRACTRADVWAGLGQETKDSIIEFVYNVGAPTYCRSSIRKRLNAGRGVEACDRILLYNKARVRGKLVPVKGLTNRRQREAAKCRSGFA